MVVDAKTTFCTARPGNHCLSRTKSRFYRKNPSALPSPFPHFFVKMSGRDPTAQKHRPVRYHRPFPPEKRHGVRYGSPGNAPEFRGKTGTQQFVATDFVLQVVLRASFLSLRHSVTIPAGDFCRSFRGRIKPRIGGEKRTAAARSGA